MKRFVLALSIFFFSCSAGAEYKSPNITADNIVSQLYGNWAMTGYKKFKDNPVLKEDIVRKIMKMNSNVVLIKELFTYYGEKTNNPKYHIKKIKDNGLVEGRSLSGIDVLKTSLFYKYEVNRKYKFVIQIKNNEKFIRQFEVIDLNTILTIEDGYFLILKKK